MKRSTHRILTTHCGSLPRPNDLLEMLMAREQGSLHDIQAFHARVRAAIGECVRKQRDTGLDIVNDGEWSKPDYSTYVKNRFTGFEGEPTPPDTSRDMLDFPEYAPYRRTGLEQLMRPKCNGPIAWKDFDAVRRDIDNLKAAAGNAEEVFMTAVSPGQVARFQGNSYYKSDEEYLWALADVLKDEYKAITDAGILLQIDDPDLPDGWQMYPDMSLREYRKYATLRVDAINHALRGIPREKVRLHVCWGSFHGPHRNDIPLEDIIDIIFRVRASSYSIEASNPVHEHEWRVFEEVKPPEGAVLIPGVVGHCCDFIEHPELVAQRLLRYAKLLGRENVMGGTDCGLGPRVGSPEIAWAKLEALAQGARLASKRLWIRPAKPSKKRAPARKKKAKR